MSDKRFDKSIRSKLKNYSKDPGNNWEALQQKIRDDIYLNDDLFDNNIKKEISKESFIIPPASWEALEKYKNRNYFRNQVYALKTGELVILLLCFFTIFNYSLWPEGPRELPVAEATISDEQLLPKEANNGNQPPETPENHKAGMATDAGVVSNINTTRTDDFGYTNVKRFVGLNEADEEENNPGDSQASINNINLNNKLSIYPLKLKSGWEDLHFARDLSPFEKNENSKEIFSPDGEWFHLVGSINNNTIHSPHDPVYNLGEKTLYTPGFGLTAYYSRRKAGSEWLLGLNYSSISYAPYPIRETYRSEEGINVVSLDNINYHILSVPLSYRNHFIESTEWSVYAGLGLQAGLVIHENYRITDKLDVPLPSPESAKGSAEYRSKLSEKEFTRAVFNGGSFSDNIILDAMLHTGIERQLGKNLHLYFDMSYSYHFASSLGPNNDRIHAFRFGTGLKFRI